MKILFLNTNIGYGGASKMIVWVANVLSNRNYDVTFLTYRDNKIQQPLSKKVRHVHLPLEPVTGKGKGLLKTIRTLRNFIKKEKFDLAVAFLSPSQLRLSLACIGLKVKLLYSQRGDPFCKPGTNKIVNLLNKWAFRIANGYVFQTQGAKEFYSQRIQNISTVIPNPVVPLTRTCVRVGHIEPRIVNVARLDIKQKRQDILINAFDTINKQFPEFKLEFYGDGPDKKTLENLASQNSNIKFMGKTSNVIEAIQNATCSVLTSDSEGIPNSLLESMSLGVPSVSTDCSPGGAAMLIDNSINGILTPKGNIDALAEALKYIITHPEDAERMGDKAKEVNEIYSEEKIANRWIDFIERMFTTNIQP